MIMALSDKEYADLRQKCIDKFRVLYKDSLCFDACKVPKDVRIRLLKDNEYIASTRALKATLFAEQLETLDNVLAGSYAGEKPTDQSATILKALEMKNRLLLEDLNITQDESNALNVTFVGMTKEDFEMCDTVEINEGSNQNVELGEDFGVGDDTDSFESRMKAKTQEKLKALEENNEEVQ